MTTRSTTLLARPQLLLIALMVDSISSAVFGVICIFDAELLGTTLGFQAPAFFVAFGLVALAYAVTLFYFARRSPINRRVAWMACIGNLIGALACVIILLIGSSPLTIAGKWTVAIGADVGAVFSLLQFIGLRQTRD